MRQISKRTAWPPILLLVGLLIIPATSGCATGPPKSGFLADYSGFEEAPPDAPIWSYVGTDERRHQLHARIWRDMRNLSALGNYDRVMIDPVVVHFKKDAGGTWVAPQRLEEMTSYMHDALVSALEDRYPIVDEPGDGVLRLRIAVTDVQAEYVYQTPDPDQHPVKAWANSQPGGASTEGEAIDSLSGERVLGLITSVRGSYYSAFEEGDRWDHTRQAIDGVARCFRRLMDEAHQQD